MHTQRVRWEAQMRVLRPRLALCVLLPLIPACSAGVNVSRCASPQLATGTGDPSYGDTAIVMRSPKAELTY